MDGVDNSQSSTPELSSCVAKQMEKNAVSFVLVLAVLLFCVVVEAIQFKVMTYNVQHGSSLSGVSTVINGTQANIVGLQVVFCEPNCVCCSTGSDENF